MRKKKARTNGARKRNGKLSRRTLLSGLGMGLTLSSVAGGARSAFAMTPDSPLHEPQILRGRGQKEDQVLDYLKVGKICFDFKNKKIVLDDPDQTLNVDPASFGQICLDVKNKKITFICV